MIPPPRPVYFDVLGTPAFGWLQGAAAPSDIGVVMCSAWGRDELCAHSAWRELAARLAATGRPVLRFDYLGCADAFDPPAGGDALGDWIASAAAAIDALKRWSGVGRVVLIGLRLGAAVAWQAAAGRTDVAAVAAVFPVVSGRAHVRELRALQAAGAGAPAAGAPFESGGFVLEPATLQSLGALDLRKTEGVTAPLLVIDRDDLPAAANWVEARRSAGLPVECVAAPGLPELLLDPHQSRIPEAAWQAACEGLRPWLGGAAASPGAERHEAPATEAAGQGVRERPVATQADGTVLRGIESTADTGASSGQAIVLLNAGAVRRIGPNRLWVSLARQWARQGHRVLRLDLAGLGDSDALPGRAAGEVYAPHAVDEVVAAVRALRERDDVRACHVVGLCSGAYHGLKAAGREAPLVTATLINPLTFSWREGMTLDAPMPDHKIAGEMQRYRSIVGSRGPWLKLLRGEVDLVGLAGRLCRGASLALGARVRSAAASVGLRGADDLGAELDRIARRGVALRFVFAEGDPGQGLLHAQAGHTVRRLQEAGALTIAVIPGADHTFTSWATRGELVELLVRQMQML